MFYNFDDGYVSSAVEASVAFASNSQSTSSSNYSSTSQSNSAGSIHGHGSNSAMSSQPVSCFMFSTPLFAGSSFQSRSMSFGTCSQFGLGISSNGVTNQTNSIKEHVEGNTPKSITRTMNFR
jgi:hypothetical protein